MPKAYIICGVRWLQHVGENGVHVAPREVQAIEKHWCLIPRSLNYMLPCNFIDASRPL